MASKPCFCWLPKGQGIHPRTPCLLQRVLGKPNTYRLRKRYGVELSLLAVSRPVCLDSLFDADCWSNDRLCLRKLGVFNKEDDEAVVLSIFWRYAVSFSGRGTLRLIWLALLQLHLHHESAAEYILARTCWVARRLGSGRLSLLAIPLGKRSTCR